MKDLRITRRQILAGTGAAGVLGALGVPATAFAEGHGGEVVRWDLIDFEPPEINPGGEDTAHADDDSSLTLSGSGTFHPGHSRRVTGGGTWRSDNADVGGSGTYRVTELVSWHQAPGSLPSFIDDDIGDIQDAHAGLAVLRIQYSDGNDGVLVVSCMLPVGGSTSMDEGINASRGFVNFFMPEPRTTGKHSNRTLFHVMRRGED